MSTCITADIQGAQTVQGGNFVERKTRESEIKIYKQRWVVAFVLSILVFSNSLSRIAFGPISYTSAEFYQTEVAMINRFALVYMVVGIPCGLAATWIMDKVGLRYSLLFAAWIHLAGCGFRILSAIENFSTIEKLCLVFAGHVLSAIAQPFLMFAPTKVAAVWFPDTQRATANTLITISNPLGILAASIFSPLFAQYPRDIMKIMIMYAIPSVIGALLALCAFRTDAPPHPPSESAKKQPEPFRKGLKQLVNNKQYWILFISVGGGIGIYTALTVFLEQILCPWGYTDFFSGVVCGSCLVLGGVLGALVAGKIADYTKQIVLISKLSFLMCVSSLALFTFTQNRQNIQTVISASCGLIGFFGMPLLPLGNELVVETTYPVEPATSTGVVFLGGQLQGMLLILALQHSAQPIDSQFINITRCKTNINETWVDVEDTVMVRDMTVSCYVFLGYATVICLGFIFFFQSANHRINLEKKRYQRKKLK